MRMWMVDPKKMCRQHLLGEHVECHMFAGTLRRGISLQGYFDHNCFEPKSLFTRHEALAGEMKKRGFRHTSPLEVLEQSDPRLINRELAYKMLHDRCEKCRGLMESVS